MILTWSIYPYGVCQGGERVGVVELGGIIHCKWEWPTFMYLDVFSNSQTVCRIDEE